VSTRTTGSSDTTATVSWEDAMLIADRCFQELGRKTVGLWRQYNVDYFGGSLHPTPVLYVPTSPYGHWVGCFYRDANIYLMHPSPKRTWAFVRGVLLHEMTHQKLAQDGLDTKHAGEPWCTEIMRLSRMLGRDIWAGKYIVKKVKGKSVRANKPKPASSTATRELNQYEISRWPYTINLEPPDLYL
jgi:hypothetical protein